MRVEWSQTARHQLLLLLAAIHVDNPRAARRLHERTRRWTLKLSSFPNSGRKGLIPGTREIFVVGTPFLVVYTVWSDSVVIDYVVHTARQWPPEDD